MEKSTKQSVDKKPQSAKMKRSLSSVTATFIVMMITWLIFSGKYDVFHISMGVISSFMVSWFSSDLLFARFKIGQLFPKWWRFIKYTPWLIGQIFLANIYVLYLVFHPRMFQKIDPKIIKFKSRLKNKVGVTTFANSITLTPGTITVRVSDGDFYVHAIDARSAEGLPGNMEKKIASIFGE